MSANPVETVFTNGRFTTMDPHHPSAQAVAVGGGRFLSVGSEEEVARYAGPGVATVDLGGRCVIPGLTDSHLHVIRGGLWYSSELRWDGVTSLAEGMDLIRRQVSRTPAPHWVRVVGGFTLHQFKEKRLPTLDELNAVSRDTPIFILHLYDRALLNRAALFQVGYTKDTPDPVGGVIERDKHGNPTGLMLANPNALLLYATLTKAPYVDEDKQETSTKLFMRELNRLGVTSAIDAGGGFQNYPDNYRVIRKIAVKGELTLRIAYNLFPQRGGYELADFTSWLDSLPVFTGNDMLHHNGGGEMLVYTAADFEDFRQVRPDMPPAMEGDLEKVVRLLAERRWPFRMHATYNETITRALNVFEKVNREIPFSDLHWFFDHAETITNQNIDRIRALNGGISVQHRMAYQGEFFRDRYGPELTASSPPLRRMLEAGIPLAAGTDATRVASYNPWICLYWLVTGKTVAGMPMYDKDNRLDRHEALRLWTANAAWFSNDAEGKGMIREGSLADFVVPSADYFTVPEDDIRNLYSHLTVLGGQVVYADSDFCRLGPRDIPVEPSWSPLHIADGYHMAKAVRSVIGPAGGCGCACGPHAALPAGAIEFGPEANFWDSLACPCWI